nr:hypothetical protein [Pseudomonas aeruginosa]
MDDASSTASETPATKPASASDEVEGVFVRATVERRCRAGFCFDKEGQGFADGVLSDEQLEALESDPLLKVERCSVRPVGKTQTGEQLMALQPRGIRNNNPGNIVWSARNNWQGQLPHDPQIEPLLSFRHGA